jgi:hypothetical protein
MFKVTWTFGGGLSESQDFHDLATAKFEADARAREYAQTHGATEAKITNEAGEQQYIRVQG